LWSPSSSPSTGWSRIRAAPEDFDQGGWAFRFDRGEEGDKFKLDELRASDAHLLGRKTYEGFAAAWPTREGPFADPKAASSLTPNLKAESLRDCVYLLPV